jgi:hypothetical protein
MDAEARSRPKRPWQKQQSALPTAGLRSAAAHQNRAVLQRVVTAGASLRGAINFRLTSQLFGRCVAACEEAATPHRYPHPFAHEISTAKKGKLNSFDLAANHEKEVGQDTRRGSRQFCAVRICLP